MGLECTAERREQQRLIGEAIHAETLAAAGIAIREARRKGLIAPGTAVWLCDDTPAGKAK